MKQHYIEKFNSNGYNIYRVPSIIVTDKGTVVVCYECRNGGDWGSTDLAIRYSADGGESWSNRQIIVRGEEINVIHNGILFYKNGIIHLLYHKNYRELYYTKSSDEGKTWSAAKDISYAYNALRGEYKWTVIAAGPGHGIVTESGRMIIPVWVSANKGNITAHQPSVVTTLYSDDDGESWKCGEIIPTNPKFTDQNESVLAELPDGRIMMNSRHITGNGMRLVCFSPNGIEKWDNFYFDPQLSEPIVAAGMTQSKSALWFTHCDCTHEQGRKNLSLHRSDDFGKTWNLVRKLDENGGYSDVYYDKHNNKLFVIAETGRAIPDNDWTFSLSVISLNGDEI